MNVFQTPQWIVRQAVKEDADRMAAAKVLRALPPGTPIPHDIAFKYGLIRGPKIVMSVK